MTRVSAAIVVALMLAVGSASVTPGAWSAAHRDPVLRSGEVVFDDVFTITDSLGTDWVYVSDQARRKAPYTLFVWLHGCGGYSQWDPWTVGDQDPSAHYLTIAPDGAEGGCWLDPDDMAHTGPHRVMVAVRAAIAQFNIDNIVNIDTSRIVLGGYSSGGDLAYRTAFEHSRRFDQVLVANSSPFRDTGRSRKELLAAATARFPVVHLAHRGDTVYPLAQVTREVKALRKAKFRVRFVVRPGKHWDTNTDADIRRYLLSRLATDN